MGSKRPNGRGFPPRELGAMAITALRIGYVETCGFVLVALYTGVYTNNLVDSLCIIFFVLAKREALRRSRDYVALRRRRD